MLNYLVLTANPNGAFTFLLTLLIQNPDTQTVIVHWKIDLPTGITESDQHRAMAGQTVVPFGKKVEAGKWEITVANNDVYTHAEIKVSAQVIDSTKAASADSLRAVVAQIVVK